MIDRKKIEKLIDEIFELEKLHWKNARYQAWISKVLRLLKGEFGENSDYYKDIYNISYGPYMISVGTPDHVFQKNYLEDLEEYKIRLESFLEEIDQLNNIIAPNTDRNTKTQIWVLGSSNPNADRSIEWNDKLPNFTDPDVIIVNLQSLTKEVTMNKDEYKLARDLMWDGFVQGSTLIFITARHVDAISGYMFDNPQYVEVIKDKKGKERHSMVDFPVDYLCPLKLRTIDVPQGSSILYSKDHPYFEYLQGVKKYNYFYELSYASLAIYQGLRPNGNYRAIQEHMITGKSGHSLGGIYKVPRFNCKGTLVLLPPITAVSVEIGIDKILAAYGKPLIKENPPPWISHVPFYQVDQLNKELHALQRQKAITETQITYKIAKRESLKKHYRLVYAKGSELEQAVYDAFKLLGFNEIQNSRGTDKEDWVFNFRIVTRFMYGIIEVKGVEKQISKEDIQQCEGWVTDYVNRNKSAKGILIANQFRLSSYTDTKEARLKIEYNLNKYAISRKICILPSAILVEAVDAILKGITRPRTEIENILSKSDGILNKLII